MLQEPPTSLGELAASKDAKSTQHRSHPRYVRNDQRKYRSYPKHRTTPDRPPASNPYLFLQENAASLSHGSDTVLMDIFTPADAAFVLNFTATCINIDKINGYLVDWAGRPGDCPAPFFPRSPELGNRFDTKSIHTQLKSMLNHPGRISKPSKKNTIPRSAWIKMECRVRLFSHQHSRNSNADRAPPELRTEDAIPGRQPVGVPQIPLDQAESQDQEPQRAREPCHRREYHLRRCPAL